MTIVSPGAAVGTFDTDMMTIALRMAERGLGTTAPNPSVGAVIANQQTGEVIARGWTQPGGRPHAEAEALARAGARANGATLYVTLEPCSHHGKTPPCVNAIIASGISRVVTGVRDPDPRVAGQGISKLNAAGIDVTEGVLEAGARWLTLGHINRLTKSRPFVQLKIAVSANGIIPHAQNGKPLWVTGDEARARVHLMRAEADAILTGTGTVLADDPLLTCRLPGMAHRSPVRIVLDTDLQMPLTSKLVLSARTVPLWIVCGRDASMDKQAALKAAGVLIVVLAEHSIANLLEVLAGEGVTRLMVEAGPRVAHAFAGDTSLIDEIVLMRGPADVPSSAGTPLSDVLSKPLFEALAHSKALRLGSSTVQLLRVAT